MMLEIYQNAAFTICFLGPTLKKTQALYSMLEELAGEGIAMGAHDPTYSESIRSSQRIQPGETA